MTYLPTHSDLDALDADDHLQYLPLVAGSARPLTGHLYIETGSNPALVLDEGGSGTDRVVVMHESAGVAKIALVRDDGTADIFIDPDAVNGTSDSQLGLFRNTITTGSVDLNLYIGDGSATLAHSIECDSGNVDLCNQGGELTCGGGIVLPTRTVTDSTDTPTGRDHVILCDATSNTVTINLPTAVGIEGRVYNIKAINVDNAVTVDANGTEEIDGSATAITLALMEVITIQSDNANWWII